MSSFLRSAFHAALPAAVPPDHHYVCLIAEHQAYGGPEEGGWWYTVSELCAYHQFANLADAQAAAVRITTLAQELTADASRSHGEHCLTSLDWLEERGLDPSFLPEPDGPTTYSVTLCQELPTFNNRRPQYC